MEDPEDPADIEDPVDPEDTEDPVVPDLAVPGHRWVAGCTIVPRCRRWAVEWDLVPRIITPAAAAACCR